MPAEMIVTQSLLPRCLGEQRQITISLLECYAGPGQNRPLAS